MKSELQIQASALRDWLCEAALPFWARTAIDFRGGWYEDLALDGTPNADKIRRLRVQARQIYVYALADKFGWYPGKEIVRNTFAFMVTHGLEPDDRPGFIHLLTQDCAVEDEQRELYDHAFYLLGCGWAFQATGDAAPLDVGQKTLEFITRHLASSSGGWLEGIPEQTPRRQNPHMHFLEACMAWHDITGDPKWMRYARDVFALFEKHFFDADNHIIREFFDDEWNRAKGKIGDTAEPGHAAEWIWLLWLFEQRSGVDTAAYAIKIYDRLLASTYGFQNDEEDADGTPRRATKRLWVQTELIKAHLAQMARGHAEAENHAARLIGMFRKTYLRDDGTWVDQIDENGAPIAPTIPVSTFYHIICMIQTACEVSGLPLSE